MAWLALGAQAQAQAPDIDPLVLPPAGLERAYACRSTLNVTSAMIGAEKSEQAGQALLGLFLIMDNEAHAQAQAAGLAEADYEKRTTDWDAAVVAAALKNAKAVLDNMVPCAEMATEVYKERAGQ